VCDRNEPEQVAEQLLTETAEGDCALGRGRRRVDDYRRAAQVSYAANFPVPRVIGETSWRLRDCPGSERLIEYPRGDRLPHRLAP
jgi:hypothetical protein